VTATGAIVKILVYMTGLSPPWAVALAALRLANRLVDHIQAGARAEGFHDVRPIHGFAFMRLAADDATAGDLAEHLGVSKQASAQLIDRMVRNGYAIRVAHPSDGRARLIRLTARGHACTRAARAAAEAEVQAWRTELNPNDRLHFERALLQLTAKISAIRPTW